MNLPGNPRSWGVEKHYVPETLGEARHLVRSLVATGVRTERAWAIVGWITAKAAGEGDTMAQSPNARSGYRKALEAVAPLHGPEPEGRRRRTRREAGAVRLAVVEAVAAAGAISAAPSSGVVRALAGVLYVTRTHDDTPSGVTWGQHDEPAVA